MAHRSEEVEFVRSVGNPLVDEDTSEKSIFPVVIDNNGNGEGGGGINGEEETDLPQCKIKRNYSCNLCPFFSQNPRSFLYHSRDVHFDRIKIFECSKCLYASKHSQKLQRHMNMIHSSGKTGGGGGGTGGGGSRIKRASKIIKMERKKEFRPIKPKPGPGPPPPLPPPPPATAAEASPHSEKEVDSKLLLGGFLGKAEDLSEGDVEEENGEPDSVGGEFKCSDCNFRNKNQKLMRRHERVVHLKKRFLRCNKCSYVTHVKARYTKHVKYHSMPMIKCDLCDFRTPYKWNLDRHYKNHCGTGAFQCSKCNFRADIKQSLTVHEMNHHVPPVGQGAITARKKNKVGASEAAVAAAEGGVARAADETAAVEDPTTTTTTETPPPTGRNPNESEARSKEEDSEKEEKKREKPVFQNIRNVKVPYTNKRESANNNHLQTDFIHPDDIVPRYGQIYVKNLKCKFCSYKAVFSHEIWRHEKRIHGYIRPESKKENIPAKRPPPKLIPIQNKGSTGNAISSPILKIPAVKHKSAVSPAEDASSPSSSPGDKSVNENEFNEMCKKSCLTSSLKDFVSLIGDEEGLKTIPDSSRDVDLDAEAWSHETVEEQNSICEFDSAKQKQTDLLKKKNASFFDKLKEKLLTGNNEEQSLFCEICGHESKCLSESVAHQKRHSDSNFKSDPEGPQESEIVLSGAELSSTRCQHCRQRCKTSADLINHLKSCKAFGASQDLPADLDLVDLKIKSEEPEFCENEEAEMKMMEENENSMENRVFVWNDLGQGHHEEEEEREGMNFEVHSSEEYLPEITSMYGTVTSKGSDNTESGTLVMEIDPRLNLTVKKVFKCPHCSFWASTASRFHVHIVGHLNKKPFECSLCLYRSNWRWDITKHIRLKSARDPSHLEAQVNMTDETGRRNYSKYNKYLTMMKVQEPTAESSGTGRRSKPAEATQGNVTERDIIPLPAPPRLTRAPTTPETPHQVPHGVPLRPPPPLKAAHQISSQPKLQSASTKENAKKTLWKCKKCNYRDSNKNNVLAHVKEHYGKNHESSSVPFDKTSETRPPSSAGAEKVVSNEATNIPSKPLTKTPSYKCGHCQQVSNWKHVIQRHCRLKHNGNSLIQIGWKESSSSAVSNSGENSNNFDPAEDSIEMLSCDICPFTTDAEGDLTAHKLNHVDRPGSIFKCSYCPFYVPSKIAVLEHMEIHGVNEGCDLTSLKVDNFDPSECNADFSTSNNGGTRDLSKRYKCRQCPYLSNSRTQFLYHKQFHRPRDAPFKCMYCSYNVSRRHLLHQHLRVHHNQREASRPKSKLQSGPPENPTSTPEESVSVGFPPEIPLVWVLKSGNFQKMFKCRWCPHVNARKINIQEHEKMHGKHPRNESDKNLTQAYHCSLKLRCPDCSYTCNNAGVLASHVKVHRGFYGEIRGLVDPTRSETDQIRELQSGLPVIEPEVVIKEEVGEVVKEEEEEEGKENRQEKSDLANQNGEPLFSQPETAYRRTSANLREGDAPEDLEETEKSLSFCDKCPARFFCGKELRIHSKFHAIHLPFRCSYCTYTARQRPHLLAHLKVHTEEYQQRSSELAGSYPVCSDRPRPKAIVLTKESRIVEGPVWVVVASPGKALASPKSKQGEGNQSRPVPKHACHRCPAKFFKSVALQHHLTLHGGSHQHKCKYCDYAVKTYGNLIKHQLVHGGEQSPREKVSKTLKFSYEFPISGKDSIEDPSRNGEESEKNSAAVVGGEDSSGRRTDPQFGLLMHGSPEFIYPTYLKNGKVKEKRYKCHKCPSAFEKRDQYRIHVSLHGSKQKYKCEKCDYSVKYYANYVQHMKKHQKHDEALKERHSRKGGLAASEVRETSENVSPPSEIASPEKQTIVSHAIVCKEERRVYDCRYCPYVSDRRDSIDGHVRRHHQQQQQQQQRLRHRGQRAKVRSGLECLYCDYSAPQRNCLREHRKLHFNNSSRYKAEAYLKCEKMELWCCEESAEEDGRNSDSNVLIFRDGGEEQVENRFFPPVEEAGEDDEEREEEIQPDGEEDGPWRIYVNPETGEPVEEDGGESSTAFEPKAHPGEVQEGFPPAEAAAPSPNPACPTVEGANEEVAQEKATKVEERKGSKPKAKRWRGKNWKCKKCPHAFGKRDQYTRHVALHGSNQKHNCDICDYSVKFYTNYVQHMRMHQTHEPDRVISVRKNCQSPEVGAGSGGPAEKKNGRRRRPSSRENLPQPEEELPVLDRCGRGDGGHSAVALPETSAEASDEETSRSPDSLPSTHRTAANDQLPSHSSGL